MSRRFHLGDDVIDSRDVISRIEDLESEVGEVGEAAGTAAALCIAGNKQDSSAPIDLDHINIEKLQEYLDQEYDD